MTSTTHHHEERTMTVSLDKGNGAKVNFHHLHPRIAEILRRVPTNARYEVLSRAHLLVNLGGGILSGALYQAVQDLRRAGSPEALEAMSRRDNHSAMRACGCYACSRDADRLDAR